MPVAIVPTPWRRQQPLGRVEIDWNNALSQGLLRLWNFAQPLSVSELVKGPADYTVVNALTPEATHFGLGLFKPANSYATTNDDYRTEIGSQLTWFLDFELANATNNSFLIGNVQGNGVGYNAGLYVNGSGKPLFFIRNTGGTGLSATGSTTLVADTRYQMVGTYDGANIRIYLNGLLEATQAQTGSVQQTDYDTGFNRWNSASTLLVRYVLGGVAKRVWSPGDVLDYRRNPWQFFKQRPLRVYFPGGAAAVLTAETGTFALTGNATGLRAGRKLTAQTGSFTLTGNAAALKFGHKLTAEVGSFTLTGNAAGLARGVSLAAAAGTFTLTGVAAGLKLDRRITANVGTFTLTGNVAGLLTGGDKEIAAELGEFALTGNAANLLATRRLTAAAGSFALTGNDILLPRSRVMAAGTGAFALTGNAAGLTYSAAVAPELLDWRLTASSVHRWTLTVTSIS